MQSNRARSNNRLRLTGKELKRASLDGFVIISRPASKGGYNVMAVRISDVKIVGWPRHVADKLDISAACTSIQRDLDKFLGVGENMSATGRMRPGLKDFKIRNMPSHG